MHKPFVLAMLLVAAIAQAPDMIHRHRVDVRNENPEASIFTTITVDWLPTGPAGKPTTVAKVVTITSAT